ncbi:MAG TPA: DUF2917 domain-containing protein [Rubrivivax sp.]|jgi:hypothetical protein|nr:DUF2917 domain-containing protein [Rubrivivax sp.]
MTLITILRKWLRILSPRFLDHSKVLEPVHLRIAEGQSICIGDAAGRTLNCLAGSVWITHDGDPKDVIVDSGESYRVTRPERMIVFALRNSAMRMR